MIKAVSRIVHEGISVTRALKALKEEPIESTLFSGKVIW